MNPILVALLSLASLGGLVLLLSLAPLWVRVVAVLALVSWMVHALVAAAIQQREEKREKEQRWARYEAHVQREKAKRLPPRTEADAAQSAGARSTAQSESGSGSVHAADEPPSPETAPVRRAERQNGFLIF